MPSRNLQSVPELAPRVLGMIRVSKTRDGETISPEIQRAAITDYSAARGYQITGWLEGIDESGSRARSAWWPRLDQAVGWVEDGTYDVIVVWEFSRTARNRLRWNVAIDRVETAGGRLESATERVDVTTAAGRFQRGVLTEMHAYRAEQIGEGWKGAHAARIRAGKPASGKPKWGYVYNREQQLHVPDPETGPVLADLYRRYVAGESVYGLVRWLNAHGHQTLTGGLWSERTLRRVLDSGFAAGLFIAHGERLEGVHDALITGPLWQAYLDARARRRAAGPRRERSQYLLSGLVRCARCDGAMVAGQFGHGHQPKYRCKAGKEQGPAACAGGYVMARFVEGEVLAWLQGIASDADEAAKAALEARAHRATARSDASRLARQVTQAEAALRRLAVQNAKTPLPATVYQESYDELSTHLAELEAAHEEAARAVRAAVRTPRAAARSLVAEWDELPVAMRREQLSALVARVRVWTGRPRGRVLVVPAWESQE